MGGPEIPALEGERLRLRSLRGSDFENYATLYPDPEVVRFISTGETWDRGRAWCHMAFALGTGSSKERAPGQPRRRPPGPFSE